MATDPDIDRSIDPRPSERTGFDISQVVTNVGVAPGSTAQGRNRFDLERCNIAGPGVTEKRDFEGRANQFLPTSGTNGQRRSGFPLTVRCRGKLAQDRSWPNPEVRRPYQRIAVRGSD
jgi:hypothetical protein